MDLIEKYNASKLMEIPHKASSVDETKFGIRIGLKKDDWIYLFKKQLDSDVVVTTIFFNKEIIVADVFTVDQVCEALS